MRESMRRDFATGFWLTANLRKRLIPKPHGQRMNPTVRSMTTLPGGIAIDWAGSEREEIGTGRRSNDLDAAAAPT